MKNPDRKTVSKFEELPNIGKAISPYFKLLGMVRPQELTGKDAFDLYNQLCLKTGKRLDPCVIDVFMSVIDFMEGGEPLPWWSFTDIRKSKLKEKDQNRS